MEIDIFSVFDSATKAYLQPFFAPTAESAIRSFRQSVNSDGPFSQFPEDFTLYCIGTWDAQKGEILGGPHFSLGVALTFVERPNFEPPVAMPERQEGSPGA